MAVDYRGKSSADPVSVLLWGALVIGLETTVLARVLVWAFRSGSVDFAVGWILVGSGALTAVRVLTVVGAVWLVRKAAQHRGVRYP